MAEHKAQHYVPRCYLQRFCDPASHPGLEPYLWVASKEGKLFKRAPKKVAVQSYYYSFVDDENNLHHDVELHLAEIEGKADPIIEKLIAGAEPDSLARDERKALSMFFAYMCIRAPRFRAHWERQLGSLTRLVGQVAASNKAYFKEVMQKLKDEGHMDPDADIEELRQFVISGKYEVSSSPVVSLKVILDLADPVAYEINDFNWRILRAKDMARFFTSDAPLTMISTTDLPALWGIGWQSPWMEALLPLSPTTALLISQHHPSGTEEVDFSSVQEANRRTAAHADEQVYSHNPIDAAELNLPFGWNGWKPLSDDVLPYYRDEKAET